MKATLGSVSLRKKQGTIFMSYVGIDIHKHYSDTHSDSDRYSDGHKREKEKEKGSVLESRQFWLDDAPEQVDAAGLALDMSVLAAIALIGRPGQA